ncbi:hypothetical protein H6P81_014359 [Aristolochia fimbriata]|uniref:Uncharacterized protein n=1 Tax=Aristolochia fimbriata TaxID=158543 RepID=A0AAV7EKL4_ARIFI|nr:hypothetical protein H6P81_014359 [Aristolochia fimbriata]
MVAGARSADSAESRNEKWGSVGTGMQGLKEAASSENGRQRRFWEERIETKIFRERERERGRGREAEGTWDVTPGLRVLVRESGQGEEGEESLSQRQL